MTAYALKTVRVNPQASIFRYEDLFVSKERLRHWRMLLRFVQPMTGRLELDDQRLDACISRPIHRSRPKEESAEDPAAQTEAAERFCRPLMETLDYS